MQIVRRDEKRAGHLLTKQVCFSDLHYAIQNFVS